MENVTQRTVLLEGKPLEYTLERKNVKNVKNMEKSKKFSKNGLTKRKSVACYVA